MSVQTNLCDPNDLMFLPQIVYVNQETENPRLKQYVGSYSDSGGGYHQLGPHSLSGAHAIVIMTCCLNPCNIRTQSEGES